MEKFGRIEKIGCQINAKRKIGDRMLTYSGISSYMRHRVWRVQINDNSFDAQKMVALKKPWHMLSDGS